MEVVTHDAKACSRCSTGLAPVSLPSSISGSSAARVKLLLCDRVWPQPSNDLTSDRFAPAPSQRFSIRNLKRPNSGEAFTVRTVSCIRAVSTPLVLCGISSFIRLRFPLAWKLASRWLLCLNAKGGPKRLPWMSFIFNSFWCSAEEANHEFSRLACCRDRKPRAGGDAFNKLQTEGELDHSDSFRRRFCKGHQGVTCDASGFAAFLIVARRCRSLARRFFREESALATKLRPTTRKKASSR